ncbi:MAG TPA: phage tail tip lysozyme [Streptosporangiaceae bacterium]|nr:phage tail tip lysozyme [Streptosporangiaceae bacterium]
MARRVAPLVALAGALAVAPHVYHVATSPTSVASDLATPNRGLPGQAAVGGNGHNAALRSHGADAAPARRGKARPTRKHGSEPSPPASQPAAQSAPSAAAPTSAPSRRAASSSPRSSSRKGNQVTLTCSGSGGLLPQNYEAIVRFLMSHGYTGLAAAGIAGNIYRESTGNPESVGTGGGGLIGWTPLPSGFVTGNPTADLRTQLSALLTYNQQWSQYIPALNAATSATQAADIYMNDFERPGVPAASEREGAAVAVAAACHL